MRLLLPENGKTRARHFAVRSGRKDEIPSAPLHCTAPGEPRHPRANLPLFFLSHFLSKESIHLNTFKTCCFCTMLANIILMSYTSKEHRSVCCADTSPTRESPVTDYPGASPEQSTWQYLTQKWRYSRKTAERLNNITRRTFYLFVLKCVRYEARTRAA